MAVNTNGDFIKSVFPTLVSKKNAVFNALFANDNQSGTIEKIFNELEETRKAWEIDGANIYNQRGEQLEKTLALFSALKRLPIDTDETILARFRFLFYRNGDTVWGDKWNILNIFKTFFNTDNVYIVNNAESFADNLLINGNFENLEGWALENGASYEREARFEETTGILFNASGKISQSVNVAGSSTYFLHWFMEGGLRVQIKDNNNRYWNADSGEFGAWGNVETWKSYESDEWTNKDLYFLTDSGVSRVTVTFGHAPGTYGFLDFVRLNKKTKASTFSLIAVFEGRATDETAVLAPGTNDPITAFNYDSFGYHSPGGEDAESIPQDVSFFDDEGTAAITEDESPTVQGGNGDVEPQEGYGNMTYMDESKALAPESPVGYEGHETVDYEKMSYFDQCFAFGTGGVAQKVLYQEIMDIIQPAGVTSVIELLTRETDE